jgi:hypothetical protein
MMQTQGGFYGKQMKVSLGWPRSISFSLDFILVRRNRKR